MRRAGALRQLAARDSRQSLPQRRGQRTRHERRFVSAEDRHDAIALDHPADASAWREEIERALARLDADQREAFLLKHMEGDGLRANGGDHRSRCVGAEDASEARVRPHAPDVDGGRECPDRDEIDCQGAGRQ